MTQLGLQLFVQDVMRRAAEPEAGTQAAEILAALRNGESLTPKEAQLRFGTMRLGARIYDLRKAGFEIEQEMVKVSHRTFVARYSMKKNERP